MDRFEAAHIANRARHNKTPEQESAIAKKAADTRLKNNPNAFKEMGHLGGKARNKSRTNNTSGKYQDDE